MKLLLDTCVLYPTVMREMLIGAAALGAFRPLWSARILEEWSRAAVKLGPEGAAQARACRDPLAAEWAAWRIDEIDQRPEGGGHDIAGHRGLCCSPAPM